MVFLFFWVLELPQRTVEIFDPTRGRAVFLPGAGVRGTAHWVLELFSALLRTFCCACYLGKGSEFLVGGLVVLFYELWWVERGESGCN